jgi:TolA-binding protein
MHGESYRTIFASRPGIVPAMMIRALNEFPVRAGRLMRVYCRLIPAFLLVLTTVGRLTAATPADRAYDAALRFFNDGTFDVADRELAEFIRNNPNSDRIPEAVLYQAQSRFQLKQYEKAEGLLRERLSAAGKWADQYRYWVAECLFQRGSFAEAASAFAQVLTEFPNSSRRLDASLGEAYARFRLGELKRVVELLSQQNGAFQLAAQARADDSLTVRGYLLLGEAYLGLKEFDAGEEALNRLADRSLLPELSWGRQYLLARLQLGGQRLDPALQTVTNLLTQLNALTNATAGRMQTDAVAVQGEILEAKGQPDAAIQAYENNLGSTVPAERRRQAVQQIVKLTLARNKIGEAGRRLEAFLEKNPNDPALELLRLTLGELRLKEFYQSPEEARKSDTNLLQIARGQFDRIVANTNSQFAGKAQFNRGWCFWEESRTSGKSEMISNSFAAFQAAAEKLLHSEEQAVAHFKMADAQFSLTNYVGAVSSYWLVATNYDDLPGIKNDLAGHALYQIVRAAIPLGDIEGADRALTQILARFPEGDYSERSLLMFGQAVSRGGKPSDARQLFADFANRFPMSALLPEVELAIARTFEQEGNWIETLRRYDRWVGIYTDHASLPRVEFDRAWANDLAGNETNAFNLFTNYVARFPTDALAPLSQYWIGYHYYRHRQYDLADLNYQKVYQNTNWPVTDLSFQARMMAGRAAFERQGYADARGYFLWIVTNGPPAFVPEALFALGDTFVRDSEAASGSSTNTLENFRRALSALEKITQSYPTNRLAPLAWGRMGDCYFELAAEDPKQYERATNAYAQLLKSDLADVTARSQATVGVAKVLEKQAERAAEPEKTALLNEALKNYLYVVEGKLLSEGEEADPLWVKEAAVAAARLAKDQKRWNTAENLYLKLKDLVPPLRKTWELRLQELEQIRSRLEPGNN